MEIGYLTGLYVSLGAKIGDLHAKDSGQSLGTTIPHNRDYLAISKPAQATIANLNSNLNNKVLFIYVLL